MRQDPAIASIVIMLRELKMHGMAQAVAELAEQGAPAFEAAQPILSQLLKAETAEREVRSVAYQLKVARFPAYRDLAGFDFSHSEVNEALVRQFGVPALADDSGLEVAAQEHIDRQHAGQHRQRRQGPMQKGDPEHGVEGEIQGPHDRRRAHLQRQGLPGVQQGQRLPDGAEMTPDHQHVD